MFKMWRLKRVGYGFQNKCGKENEKMWISILIKAMCGGILLFETIKDIKDQRVHTIGAGIILLLGIILGIFQKEITVFSCITSMALGIFLLAISMLTEEKIGKGDAIYMIALGVLVGFREIMMISMLSFMSAAVMSICLLILKKVNKNTRISFFPYLSFGYIIMFGCAIWQSVAMGKS